MQPPMFNPHYLESGMPSQIMIESGQLQDTMWGINANQEVYRREMQLNNSNCQCKPGKLVYVDRIVNCDGSGAFLSATTWSLTRYQ